MVHEDDCRLFNCQHCERQLRVCRRCDRGQRYCSGACQVKGRRRSVGRANARYQHTPRGARFHAARQARWRERQKNKVTYHRLAERAVRAKLCSVVVSERRADDITDEAHRVVRCDFCARALDGFIRLGPLRRGSHQHGWG
jgi:hypothetical protein